MLSIILAHWTLAQVVVGQSSTGNVRSPKSMYYWVGSKKMTCKVLLWAISICVPNLLAGKPLHFNLAHKTAHATFTCSNSIIINKYNLAHISFLWLVKGTELHFRKSSCPCPFITSSIPVWPNGAQAIHLSPNFMIHPVIIVTSYSFHWELVVWNRCFLHSLRFWGKQMMWGHI